VVVIAMYRLVRFDYDSACAYRAVWFLLIFPTSYFFQIAYTESLFLALIITAFLACRHDRWLLAGALGAFAALTHDTGVLLVAALGAEALQRYSETRRWNYSWLWLGLIPVGLGVFLLINQCAAGNPLTFLEVAAEHWSDHLVYPWHFWDQLGVFTYMQPAGAEILGTQVVSYVAIALVASIVSSWSLRPSYFIWMATNWLVIAGQSWNLSGPRLVLIMFPMFLLEALASRNRLVFGAITIWSLLFLGLFSNEFSAGHWTF
jgi:hypothetical protein